jgi:tetratricopeptide (TPR) repeat protein
MSAEYRTRLRTLIALNVYAAVAASALFQALRPGSVLLGALFTVAMASAATLWCVVDSGILGRPLVTSLHWIMFMTWPVAVPAYLVCFRKFRGFLLALGHGVGLLIVCGVLFAIPAWSAYWFACQGYAALEDRQYDRAVVALKRAVVLNESDAASWYSLGVALERSGRIVDAIAAYQRALELNPKWAPCRGALANCRKRLAGEMPLPGDHPGGETED